MGNGQLIHLEIDSGCGVPCNPGQALGNWSRARSWPQIGQAAGELECWFQVCRHRLDPLETEGPGGLVCLLPKHASKT